MKSFDRLFKLLKFYWRCAISKPVKYCDYEYFFEHYDLDFVLTMQELEIYQLVDFLVHDVRRLALLVMETRDQVNTLANKLKSVEPPYPLTAENVWDASYDDHPAMLRYLELFGVQCPSEM